MDAPAFTEPAAQVLAKARAAGFAVSTAQLARWHRIGLLPQPRTRSLGRGHGTQTMYPAGTGDQSIKLCQLRKRHRNLREVGWRLWWLGYSVEEGWSQGHLQAAAADMDRMLESLRAANETLNSNDDDVADKAFADLEAACGKRLPKSFASQLRRRIGRRNFAMLVRFILTFVSGDLESFRSTAYGGRDDGDDPDATIRKALGFVRDRQHPAPWIERSIWPALQNASGAIVEMTFTEMLAKTSINDLALARDELRDLLSGVAILTGGLRLAWRTQNPLGLNVLADIASRANANDLAWLLIPWCRIRTKEWVQGYSAIVSACRSVLGIAQGVHP